MRHFPGPYGNGMGIWFGVAGFIGTLLVIALIVALVVIMSRRNKQPGTHPASPPATTAAALQVLDHRLATGEIDITDYQARRAALLGEAPTHTEWTPTPPVAEDAAPPPEEPKA